jgi:hypothetical protein
MESPWFYGQLGDTHCVCMACLTGTGVSDGVVGRADAAEAAHEASVAGEPSERSAARRSQGGDPSSSKELRNA